MGKKRKRQNTENAMRKTEEITEKADKGKWNRMITTSDRIITKI